MKNIERSMLALSKKKDAESATSLGRLGRLHAQISSENRKAAKEERRAGAELTPQIVIAWAKALSPAERVEIARQFNAIDEKRSGLA